MIVPPRAHGDHDQELQNIEPDESTARPVTFFKVIGPSHRTLTCSAYQNETAVELRLWYSNGDVLQAELFRGSDRDEFLAWTAEVWRLALIEKGFQELPTS